jgi:Z1 domain
MVERAGQSQEPERIEMIAQAPNRGRLWIPSVGAETMSLLQEFPADNRDTVRDEAISVLSRCVPPAVPSGRETGLVVGYVQSGKTMSFTTVSALAQDNHYQMIIVITGISINLFRQSKERLQEDLHLPDLSRRWKHFSNPSLKGTARRSIESALLRWRDHEIQAHERQTVLITVMKQHSHLKNLIDLLSGLSVELGGVPTLVIDDEADQAGLNTMVRKGGESTTYQRLLSLRGLLPHHTFLQYTATPQAPLLINIIDALSPSFAEVLTPGQSYTGGRTFFNEQYMSLIRRIPGAEIPTNDNVLTEPPDSLLAAMKVFFLGVAAGIRLAGMDRGGAPRNRSMMVHPSIRTSYHVDYFRWVDAVMKRWQVTLALPTDDPDRQELIEEFREAYDDLARTVPDLLPFDELISVLQRAIRETVPIEVNARGEGRTPPVEWQQDYSHILVGGQAVERGYTVEGLTVTYMPRGRGVGNADTIQQRARWFGYKAGYLGYCRVYLSSETADAYRSYMEHEEDIRRRLREHSRRGGSLKEWKRAFLLDTGLRPTRNNVLSLDYMQDVYSNDWFTPRAPHESPEAVAENRTLVQRFISNYRFSPDAGDERRQEHQRHLVATSVPLRDAYENLLIPLRTPRASDSTPFTGLRLQIERYLSDNPDATCIVYRMSGGIVRDRDVKENIDELRRLFQGAYPDTKGEIYPGDSKVRVKGELTIQIHALRVLNRKKRRVLAEDVPAIAVFVPAEMTAGWLVQEEEDTE